METSTNIIKQEKPLDIETVFIKTEPGVGDEFTDDNLEIKQQSSYNSDPNDISETELSTSVHTEININQYDLSDCNKELTLSHKDCTDYEREFIKVDICHLLNHSGVNSHRCNVCNKDFIGAGNLKNHLLIHSGEKPHKCKECNKEFTQAGSLKNHLLIHRGIKLHKCKVCNKEFTYAGNLKSHSITHSDIKPHKCNECNKDFNKISNLNRHMLIHSGIKPYKCKECAREFTQSGSLKTHMLTHSGIDLH